MASKAYSYELTDSAERDIDEILYYISVFLENPIAATDMADALELCFDNLCQKPKSGAYVENEYLRTPDVRWVKVKNYIVYYLADEAAKRIIILKVIYRGQDRDKVIREM